jgi:hypothetical protein
MATPRGRFRPPASARSDRDDAEGPKPTGSRNVAARVEIEVATCQRRHQHGSTRARPAAFHWVGPPPFPALVRLCLPRCKPPQRNCWWKSGPKGGRRHNSPLSSLPPALATTRLLLLLALGEETIKLNNTVKETKNTQQTEDRKTSCCLRCSLLITVCPFHYKGFTIYRRPLGIVICLNYTFSVPDKLL